MPRTLIRKNPSNFKTLPLHVEASPEGLSYQSIGKPLNFAQTLQRRKPIQLGDHQHFVAELANLGVSVRLTLQWQNRDYWVLVRQRRQDRGDVVLKLISGYVPAQELKGFAKTRLLNPGESQEVTISIPVESLASYDDKTTAWVTKSGNYQFKVGASSRDIKLEKTIKVKSYGRSEIRIHQSN